MVTEFNKTAGSTYFYKPAVFSLIIHRFKKYQSQSFFLNIFSKIIEIITTKIKTNSKP